MASETDTSHAQSGLEHAGEAAEHGGGMPQLDFSTWASQIFWTAIALFILYRVLTGTILPRISNALEDRHNAIVGDLDRAAELKEKAEQAEAAHAEALSTARANAQKIVAETQSEIDAELAAASAEAEAEIAARTAESETRINAVRAEAATSAKQIASETARAIVAKFAPGLADNSAIDAAVDRALTASGVAK